MVSVVAVKDGSNKKPIFDRIVKDDDHQGLGQVCEALHLNRDLFDDSVAAAIFNKKKIVLNARGMRIVIQAK